MSKQLQHWLTFRSILLDAWRTAYYCGEEELIKNTCSCLCDGTADMRTWAVAGAWHLTDGQMGCEMPVLSPSNDTDKDGCDHFKGPICQCCPSLNAVPCSLPAVEEMFANCQQMSHFTFCRCNYQWCGMNMDEA